MTIALVALLVSAGSLAYAWRAFALQRYSSSSSGLHFLHVNLAEKQKEEAPAGLEYHTPRPYLVSQILSRGPGLRYGAQGAVWGEGDFSVFTPQVAVWGPNDPGIEFVLKPDSDNKWSNVFCGVIWESPRMFRKGFATHGFRVQVPAPGTENPAFVAESWMERKNEWRPLKTRVSADVDPIASAVARGESSLRQLGKRYPNWGVLDDLKARMSGESAAGDH